MRYNENVRGKGGAVRTSVTDKNDQRAGRAANGGVEKRARETAKREIVGDELCRTCEYIKQIAHKKLAAHSRNGSRYWSRNEKCKI